jgi:threonine dehydratase
VEPATVTRIPDFDDVRAAARRIAGHARRTPLLANTPLDALTGGRVLLKLETLQHTGSFKFRGAWNRLSQLDEGQRAAGVVAFSSGNHAQGVAEAARRLGIRATIVMPSDAPRVKMQNTLDLGAEVVEYDRVRESREQIAASIAAERGATLVPSFDDPDVIAGQGTVGLEIAEQAAELGLTLDDAIVCCSGGGLTAGIALALGELAPHAGIWTAEPAAYDDHARSLAAGRRQRNEPGTPTSICDALLAPMPGELTFAINQARLRGGLRVCGANAEARRGTGRRGRPRLPARRQDRCARPDGGVDLVGRQHRRRLAGASARGYRVNRPALLSRG